MKFEFKLKRMVKIEVGVWIYRSYSPPPFLWGGGIAELVPRHAAYVPFSGIKPTRSSSHDEEAEALFLLDRRVFCSVDECYCKFMQNI